MVWFCNYCFCCLAATPEKLGIPTIARVTQSGVTLAYDPPANTDDSRAMIRSSNYRKDGQSE